MKTHAKNDHQNNRRYKFTLSLSISCVVVCIGALVAMLIIGNFAALNIFIALFFLAISVQSVIKNLRCKD